MCANRSSMEAALLTSPQDIAKRPLRIEQVPQPQVEAGDVLLRVRACGAAIERGPFAWKTVCRHCEEHSDEAIQMRTFWIASSALPPLDDDQR